MQIHIKMPTSILPEILHKRNYYFQFWKFNFKIKFYLDGSFFLVLFLFPTRFFFSLYIFLFLFYLYTFLFASVYSCGIYLGRRIFHYIKTRNIRGETGQVAFDDNGDRMFAEYEVINVRDHQRKKIVGKLLYDAVCRQFIVHRSINNIFILVENLYGLNRNHEHQNRSKKLMSYGCQQKYQQIFFISLMLRNSSKVWPAGFHFIFVNFTISIT